MEAGTYLVERTTAADVASHGRLERWNALLDSVYCRMSYEYREPDRYRGNIVRMRSDSYQLVRWTSGEMVCRRTDSHVRWDPNGSYRLLVPLSRQVMLRQGDREVLLTPGRGGICDLSQSFELWLNPMTDTLVFTIPREDVNNRVGGASPLASRLDLSTGLGRVIADSTASLYRERSSLSAFAFNSVCERLVELMCLALGGAEDREDLPGHLADVVTAVRRYVRDHAADPGLTGRRVARAVGWSLRQVQLALHEVGTTPRDLIREERLRLARERLESPAFRHMSIAELACQSGFASPSSFSSVFHARFGISPRELRTASAAARQ